MADETNAGGDASGAMSVDQAVEALLKPPARDKAEEREESDDEATPETEKADDDEGSSESQADEDDADEEQEADDEGEEDADEKPAAAYAKESAKVKLPDGTETTVADLVKGSLRQADYTRKTQELSEERKRIREVNEKVETFSKTILERLQVAEKLAERARPAPPPNELYDTDPVQYLMLERLYDRAMQEWQRDYDATVDAVRQTLDVKDEAKKARSDEELEANRKKLREAIPDLNDEAKKPAVIRDIVTAAEKAGFTAEDVNGWVDPRIAVLAHMAAKAVKMEQAKPKAEKKVKEAPPVQKAGARSSAKEGKRSEQMTAMRRLAQTKSRDDAVAALLARSR